MVKVSFYYQTNNIVRTEVEGHANFDQHGQDIVCAGISAIVFGSLNALDNLVSKQEIKIEQSNNKIVINVRQATNANQMILKTMLWQLKTISEQYHKNISIKEVY